MYLSKLNSDYPMRNTKEQKRLFREFALEEVKKFGYEAETQVNSKHSNVVIGDPERAEAVFTAHYDTPWRMVVPNLMLPLNKPLYYAYNFAIVLVMLAISFGFAYLMGRLFGNGNERAAFIASYFSYLICYFGLFILFFFGFKNRYNYNDNTSGVASVLSLAKKLDGDPRAAFILFDDEEKGKLGSKAFAKAHPDIKKDKPVINMDCVGNGESFIVSLPDGLKGGKIHKAIEESLKNENGYSFYIHPSKKVAMNSDQKSFALGVGVCACLYSKTVGFYAPNIHTPKDKTASEDNIQFLTDALFCVVNKL